jgi:hypothetical protein
LEENVKRMHYIFFGIPLKVFHHDYKVVEVGWTRGGWVETSKNRVSGRPVASTMGKTSKKHPKHQKQRGKDEKTKYLCFINH